MIKECIKLMDRQYQNIEELSSLEIFKNRCDIQFSSLEIFKNRRDI